MLETANKSWRVHLLALAFFALSTLAMTWPVVARLTTQLAGGRDDLWVHQWTFWWVREALHQGLNPFFTPYLYAPIGVSLTSHNIAWFNIALWLPLQAFLGSVTAYNLVLLAVLILNGFSLYLFASQEIRNVGAALVAGVVFGFWPYTLSHYDHANMMVLFWVPLTLILLRRLIVRPDNATQGVQAARRWWVIALPGFTLAMIGITRWQLLIMSIPVLAGYTLFLLWRYPSARTPRTYLALAGIMLFATLLMAPLLAPLVRDQSTSQFLGDALLDEAIWGRTDLLAYFIPSIHNGLWQARVAQLYERFVVNQFYTPYLGFLTLLLAAVGLLKRWQKTWIWLLIALLYFTLALGPELAIGGRSYPAIPMPYRLVEDSFLLRLIRRPDRLNLFLSLPLAMMAGWGVQTLLFRLGKPAVRVLTVTAVIVLLLLAYAPVPFATSEVVTPSWYKKVAAQDPVAITFDLPLNDRSYDKWYMHYQTQHGLPIATGHVSRLPREAGAFLNSVPLLKNLPERDQLPDQAIGDIAQQLRLLANAGIEYIILHKRFANEGLQAAWREWLVVDPEHEDEDLLVFSTSPEHGEAFRFDHVLAGNIGLLETSYAPATANQRGVVKVHSVWGTSAPPGRAYDVCLLLLDNQAAEHSRYCQAISNMHLVDEWTANDLYRLSHAAPLASDLPPGVYQLAMSLAESSAGELQGNTAILGELVVEAYAPSFEYDALWQNGIRLHSAQIEEEGDNLAVTLYWETEQEIFDSLKAFVHVIRPDTGEISAQSDAIPRDWSYPTTAWEPNEIVRDQRLIPLQDIEGGMYAVQVGWYDERTGQRIPLAGSEEDRSKDAFVIGSWQQ